MLGPSFVSGGQQVFEFVRMMAHNKYLRCAQLANASRVGNLEQHPLQDHAKERSIVETAQTTGTSWPSGARLP